MPTNSKHACPTDGSPLPYIALFVNEDNTMVIARRDGDKQCFPRLQCPEIPLYGRKLCECFSKQFKMMCGTEYELVFLYSSINDVRTYASRPINAMFQCISPIDGQSGKLVSPASEEYEWMQTSEVERLIFGSGTDWKDDVDEEEACSCLDVGLYSEGNKEGSRAWELPGWYTRTNNEAISVLQRLGYVVKGAFEQSSITRNASVMRVETNKGLVYLKASIGEEGKITTLVASFAHHLLPKPIFVNEKERWMLMSDCGEPMDHRCKTKIDFDKLTVSLGELHMASMEHIGALKEAGVPVVSGESLRCRLKIMLNDDRVRRMCGAKKEFETCTEEGVADLLVYYDAVCELLRELYEEGKCPLCLVHGDLTGNIMIANDGSQVLIDWGSSLIDIPLRDIYNFAHRLTPDAMEKYLRLWEKYASPSDLLSLLKIMWVKGSVAAVLEDYEYDLSDSRSYPLRGISMDQLAELLLEAKKIVSRRNK